MERAYCRAYCTGCVADVALSEYGTCPRHHPPTMLRNVRECDPSEHIDIPQYRGAPVVRFMDWLLGTADRIAAVDRVTRVSVGTVVLWVVGLSALNHLLTLSGSRSSALDNPELYNFFTLMFLGWTVLCVVFGTLWYRASTD